MDTDTHQLMAWERAKGELNSILHTMDPTGQNDKRYRTYKIKLKKFISDVESTELLFAKSNINSS